MRHYTKEDIIRLVREEDAQFIRMQFTDIFGQLKNVAITASQIGRALDNQIMMDAALSRDSSALKNQTSISGRTWTPLPSCPGGPSTARWPG